jgi:hypothetical protein
VLLLLWTVSQKLFLPTFLRDFLRILRFWATLSERWDTRFVWVWVRVCVCVCVCARTRVLAHIALPPNSHPTLHQRRCAALTVMPVDTSWSPTSSPRAWTACSGASGSQQKRGSRAFHSWCSTPSGQLVFRFNALSFALPFANRVQRLMKRVANSLPNDARQHGDQRKQLRD